MAKTNGEDVMTYSKCQEEHERIAVRSRWVVGLLFSLIIFIAGFLGSCSSSLYNKIEGHSIKLGVHEERLKNMDEHLKSMDEKLDLILNKLMEKK